MEQKKLEALNLGIDADQLDQLEINAGKKKSPTTKVTSKTPRRERLQFKHKASKRMRAAQLFLSSTIVVMAFYAYSQLPDGNEL